jgi:hypothetical protein
MRKTSMTIISICIGFLWLGEAHAARFETHATNRNVPVGTVYDTTTKLLWEQKTAPGTGGVHDVNNRYSWSTTSGGSMSLTDPNGTAFVTFLGTLNNARSGNGATVTGCFANRCDWRLPQSNELKGIVAPGRANPSIDPIFGRTQSDSYWSATTCTGSVCTGAPVSAWVVSFSRGDFLPFLKAFPLYVRAVRSGL